ncbi:LamG-like jellyroll fold domain-containing protein [Muribaculum intestinale]|uniref:LamG-like jellyroll fold domain-containing protein n=1 Tax=Muribaculum intestinale TaxID=1796646 RepID=UPI00242C4558|nr:LamG-like jellyroll fold domain-containing protein [Muribaculum intestinale]
MAQEQYLVLHLPFDEAEGAATTYDFSSNRADGVLTNAHFEAGKQGNCINYDGTAKCEVQPSVLSLSKEFTLCAWIKLHKISEHLIVLVNYSGVDHYYKCVVPLQPDTWYYITLTRDGNVLCVYLNGTILERAVVPSSYGNPIGINICQDCYNTTLGHGCVDELKLYQKALSQEELIDELDNTKQLAYLLDGLDFKAFGVSVSKARGLMDGLKMKEPLKVEFNGYHGEAIDLSRPRYEAREISLECFIDTVGGKMAFVQAVQEFLEQFRAKHLPPSPTINAELCPAGLHRLTLDIHPTKPLIYEVYLPDATDIDKEWNDKRMIGTFTLTLREPEPVKRVLKHMRTNEANKRISITLTSSKLVNIYWGDGTTTQDVCGTNVTVTHDYAYNGEYYAVITGVIEDIEAFSTNAIIVWNKL